MSATAVKEQQKVEAPTGIAAVSGMFPAADGWRNVHLYGTTWRCNRWELTGRGWAISESFHVRVEDGVLVTK